ncbi:MAG TPA: hypothetical protein VK400_03425 [Pyrinomonadaceae bacterium]|nr:hypothetical protein [Pyrinomonadaceae bacterium]
MIIIVAAGESLFQPRSRKQKYEEGKQHKNTIQTFHMTVPFFAVMHCPKQSRKRLREQRPKALRIAGNQL